jgi:hypothetical protein
LTTPHVVVFEFNDNPVAAVVVTACSYIADYFIVVDVMIVVAVVLELLNVIFFIIQLLIIFIILWFYKKRTMIAINLDFTRCSYGYLRLVMYS